MVVATNVPVSTGSYSIVVGGGGAGRAESASVSGVSGSDSSALSQTTAIGGGGAVREVCESILKAKRLWQTTLEGFL